MPKKRSEAWKNLERSVALSARDAGFKKAFRVCRGDDIGISAVDVILPEIPFVKIDTKYRGNSFNHHSLFYESEKKYCDKNQDFMALPTKGGRERGSLVTVRLEVLLELLAHKYLPKDRPIDTVGCPKCNSVCDTKPIGLNLTECLCGSCGVTFFMGTKDIPEKLPEAPAEDTEVIEYPLEVLLRDPEHKELTQVKPKAKRRTKTAHE